MRLRPVVRAYSLIAVNLLTLLLLLLLLNAIPWVGLQIRPWIESVVGETYPLMRALPDKTRAELYALRRETWSRQFNYDPLAQFKESEHRGDYVNVDAQGFRRGAAPQAWPPPDDAYTVFVFGGSTTFGYGVADAETIPAALQRLLSASSAPRPVQVYNFGRGFYDSNHELMLFVQLLWRGHKPDLAVFVDGTNEMAAAGEPRLLYTGTLTEKMQRIPGPDVWPALRVAWLHTPLVRFVIWVKSLLPPPSDGRDVVSPAPTDDSTHRRAVAVLDRYAANARLIRAVAREHNVNVQFVWQPIPTFAYDLENHPFGVEDSMQDPAQAHCYALLSQNLDGRTTSWRQHQIAWCASVGLDRAELLYVDPLHYSPAMNQLVAECILEALPHRDGSPAGG